LVLSRLGLPAPPPLRRPAVARVGDAERDDDGLEATDPATLASGVRTSICSSSSLLRRSRSRACGERGSPSDVRCCEACRLSAVWRRSGAGAISSRGGGEGGRGEWVGLSRRGCGCVREPVRCWSCAEAERCEEEERKRKSQCAGNLMTREGEARPRGFRAWRRVWPIVTTSTFSARASSKWGRKRLRGTYAFSPSSCAPPSPQLACSTARATEYAPPLARTRRNRRRRASHRAQTAVVLLLLFSCSPSSSRPRPPHFLAMTTTTHVHEGPCQVRPVSPLCQYAACSSAHSSSRATGLPRGAQARG